ncbi:hypothetical protein [Streptosporangium roseum]|uniref:Uncharacterized protein n=1 Tax=Streptosporangium roseum (strain ATCC 12428 / DSM 43021 / JCM 3005 / KCTC 9067 / NCIMB 10171 / NRRL 2505 / NI 9100) TaxID=479432 RepID=D2B8F5_STRRD|nr:hypothetical protein [Streptosporangium roseum]ACZ87765.1 hypothetical protein Sros_4965 [Streptosporangium roseum DSM 43021]
MSDGHPTAAQKAALRLICDHEPLEAGQLGEHPVAARRLSTDPGFGPAIARMAGTSTWRLHAQGFIAGTESGNGWTTTANGRELIACAGTRG